MPQIHRIHLLFSYQQLEQYKLFFELKINFCFISDRRNSFYCKLEKLIKETFPFHLVQSSNTEFLLIHNESKTDRANVQMCVIIKTRCFYSLPLIHNQN